MSRGARSFRWASLLIVVLLGGVVGGGVAFAVQTGPQLRLNANLADSLLDEATTNALGSGFGAGAVTITVTAPSDDPSPFARPEVILTRQATPANGVFSVDLTFSITKRPGVYGVRAVQGSASATATFYVFSWSISPTQGPPGTAVRITGQFFPPNRSFNPRWEFADGGSVTAFSMAADGDGDLSATTTAPTGLRPGANQIRFDYAFTTRQLSSSRRFIVPTDLTVSHIELTQVVQRFDNSVPLIAGKPTVARVYVNAETPGATANGGMARVPGVRLSATRDGQFQGSIDVGVPLDVAPRTVDPRTLRDRAAATYNILLPSAWTALAGPNTSFSVTATVNPSNTLAESTTSNNSLTRTALLVPTLPFNFIGLRYQDPDLPASLVSSGAFETFRQYVQRTWPVARVNRITPANDIFNWTTKTDSPGDYMPATNYLACHPIVQAASAMAAQASAPNNTYPNLILSPVRTAGTGGPRGGCAVQGGLGALVTDDTRTTFTTEGSPIGGIVSSQELAHTRSLRHTGHAVDDPNCCTHSGLSRSTSDLAFGFDVTTMSVIAPGTASAGSSHAHDVMTDVLQSSAVWPSDYTYELLLRRFRLTPLGAAPPDDPAYLAGALPEEAYRQAATAPMLLVRGMIGQPNPTLDRQTLALMPPAERLLALADTASFAPSYLLDLSTDLDEGGDSGSFTLELRDAAGTALVSRSFDLDLTENHENPLGPWGFLRALPWDARATSLVLRSGDRVLAEQRASGNAPTVRVLTPGEGVDWGGVRRVTWEASDADGDALVFAVQYSSDGGRTWTPLAIDESGASPTVDADLLAGSRDCLVRVLASDGFRTTVALSAVFGVERHQPTAQIVGEPLVQPSGQVLMEGVATDADDGIVGDERLVWSSDRAGALGVGPTLVTPPLTAGLHRITLTVTDSDGNQAVALREVMIPERPVEPELVGDE